MRRAKGQAGWWFGAAAALALAWGVIARSAAVQDGAGGRDDEGGGFAALDVWVERVDGGEIAAYQVEFKAAGGEGEGAGREPGLRIVGIEGGEHGAFQEAPYYDPRAMMNDRVIIAAFCTDAALPRGGARVARLHVEYSGRELPGFEVRLVVAGDRDARRVDARARVARADAKDGR